MTRERILELFREHPNYMMEKSFRIWCSDIYEEICNIEFPEKFHFNQKLYHYFHDDLEFKLGICPECGKRCGYLNFFEGYSKYCSIKCSSNSKEVREKTENTCLKKYKKRHVLSVPEIREKGCDTIQSIYGVRIATQAPEIQEKIVQTNLEIYHVPRPTMAQSVKDKVMNTNMENLGVPWPGMSEQVMEKGRQTNMRKRGVPYALQDIAVREKGKQTSRIKYNTDSPNAADIVKEHKRLAIQEKYHVDNVFQDPAVKEKIKQTHLRKTGYDNPSKNPAVRKKISDANRGKHFNTSIVVSSGEKEMSAYIHEIYNDVIIESDRKTIGLEIDVYLPKLKIGFEYNGDFWHMNPRFYKEDDIHPVKKHKAKDKWQEDQTKFDIAKNEGITIYYVWEYDWIHDNEKTKEKIKNIIYSLN